jgi:alkylation response protein AidB-like acyl-CoA dehydrogenase
MERMATQHPQADRPSIIDAWRDLVPSPERRQLIEVVRRHFADRFPISARHAPAPGAEANATAWDDVSAAGYPAIGLPEDAGGAGSAVDLVAVLEEAGRALLSAPLLATVLALQVLRAVGLPPSPAERPGALGRGRGEWHEGRLDLDEAYVLDGAAAQWLAVLIPAGEGVIVVQLDAGDLPAPVVSAHLDPGRPIARFPASRVRPRAATSAAMPEDAVLAPARVAVAADLVGVAAGALDRAVAHALDREQFGKKLGAFQGVKHRLADGYVAVERARSLTRAAAILLEHPEADPQAAARLPLLAQAAAAEAAAGTTSSLVQVLGAMGMTSESDAHLFFRRAQQTAAFLGSPADCYARAADIALTSAEGIR